MSLLSSRALRRDGNRALQENAGSLDAIDNGAALVVDRTAGGAAGFGRLLERGVVELRADQRLGSALDQKRGRRHSTETDTGGGANAVFQREADAEADHRDVHLGARDHA